MIALHVNSITLLHSYKYWSKLIVNEILLLNHPYPDISNTVRNPGGFDASNINTTLKAHTH